MIEEAIEKRRRENSKRRIDAINAVKVQIDKNKQLLIIAHRQLLQKGDSYFWNKRARWGSQRKEELKRKLKSLTDRPKCEVCGCVIGRWTRSVNPDRCQLHGRKRKTEKYFHKERKMLPPPGQ